MEELQEDLEKREAILKEREEMVKNKSELEIKKLRSSQVLSKVRFTCWWRTVMHGNSLELIEISSINTL